MKNLIMILGLAIGLVSCHGTSVTFSSGSTPTGTGYTPTLGDEAQDFALQLKLDGGGFENFYVLKAPTDQGDGWVVLEDGYGDIYTINLYDDSLRYSYGTDLSYFDNQAIPATYIGGGYYEDIDGYIYEETNVSTKDLEKMGVALENLNNMKMAQSITEKFGLSDERGLEVAKMVNSYKKISGTRKVTSKDNNVFMEKLLGVDAKTGIEAFTELAQGSSEKFEDVVERAAEVNGTSPENVRAIITDVLKI